MIRGKVIRLAALGMIAGACVCAGASKKSHSSAKPSPKLGHVLYIGDSITHGYGAPSYRWALHKIFVDNGIEYDEIGVEVGNNKAAGNAAFLIEQGTTYLGVPFRNLHAAMSSQRAYETSGRNHEKSQRLGGTDIFDWLKLPQADKTDRQLDEMPDTCFILLGTNDTLSDYGGKGGIAKNISEVSKALTSGKNGDIPVIMDALKKANPKVKVVLLSIPAWGATRSNNTAADYKSVLQTLNKQYASLAKKKKAVYVDLNEGLVDKTCEETPGRAVASFVNRGDQLHPTLQGDLIMAGLVARTMGYAGRSAGLPRKASAKFDQSASMLFEGARSKEGVTLDGEKLVMGGGGKLEVTWPTGSDVSKGFSAQAKVALGNGSKGGWQNTESLVLTVGNGEHTARLVFKEGAICWGKDTVLYPIDMSTNKEAVRVTWVKGNPDEHLNPGFYVWLGDMCIGEGLPDVAPALNGMVIENVSSEEITVESAALDGASSAPAPVGLVKEEKIYGE